ncbi:hypothetical protein [Isoptericola dokdonensis]|jgi:hypothetical protein|uniref:Uncharacterized protein n=1 Tax=Isoptericola dokdonensis DS-3 TaxID=1300344 RepID=A0A161HRW1_9MICO|nr:hypothetical protein [Isoptericola dokdonensis]ANC32092.1 hypothetical protein I598_2558 [Isoptericola dokdonensis DS-3]
MTAASPVAAPAPPEAGGAPSDTVPWDARDVARWVGRLGIAGISWPTTRRLAVAVDLAGIARVAALGDAVVEGSPAGRTVVQALLAEVRPLPVPADFLHQVARTQRLVSRDGSGEGPE